jgi:SAM-dependent methyltransferase
MEISHSLKKIATVLGRQLLQIGTQRNHLDEQEILYKKQYEKNLSDLQNLSANNRGFRVYREYRFEVGDHPLTLKDLECEFFAYHLYRAKPSNILDIGSYRDFILGLLAYYDVTTIDIRKRIQCLKNETVFTTDAKALPCQSDSFDAVLSMETLSHIGLGRYGDSLDLDADLKAFQEMRRVLKPGGLLMFTSAITGGLPSLAFNARRNYSYEMIRDFCKGLEFQEEKLFDRRHQRYCRKEELTTDLTFFDYYFGCYRKP